jgi:hypothetical protein
MRARAMSAGEREGDFGARESSSGSEDSSRLAMTRERPAAGPLEVSSVSAPRGKSGRPC